MRRSLLVFFVVLLWVQPGVAQTAEQLRMLQQLSAEQRARVLQQLGVDQPAPVATAPAPLPALVLDRELEKAPPEVPDEPRVAAGSTVAVQLSHPGDRNATERRQLEAELTPRVLDLLGTSVFEVDTDGVLVISDFYAIPLAGLTEAQAARRLQAEPDFRDFQVTVTVLPLTGPVELEPFGYDLFAGEPTTFAPANDIPVPSDYVIGPGDTVVIQLFGNENVRYVLAVDRDGQIQVPEIGPVTVTGMRFDAMREELSRRIGKQKIGVQSSITLGELRSIQVFVLGDAYAPGSYMVSALATMTNALHLSGGIAEQGSLRAIELKRNGRVVRRLDLYQLLLEGDTRNDVRLQAGDAIFVPPVGARVAIEGEIVRPAIYELRGEQTVQQLIELAGGLLPSADRSAVTIERVDSTAGRRVLSVDIATAAGRATRLQAGDHVKVVPVLEDTDDSVVVLGHVQRPGARQYRRGMTLTDVLPSGTALRGQADLHYVLIVRETGDERFVTLRSANLAAAWNGDGAQDVVLQPRDKVVVFGLDADRADRIEPYLEQLRRQTRNGSPVPEVRVGGHIVAPGLFPLEPGMRVSDLVRASAGLRESAYTLEAELARYATDSGMTRQTELVSVDLDGILRGDAGSDLLLRPYDHLIIKEIPLWQAQESVELLGEVRFPGTYILQRGETLSSVLRRAGGLTDLAFAEGSVFVRETLKAREQEQIENLAARLEADIVAFSLQALQTDANAGQALSIGQSLLQQLRATEAAGRLVIDIDAIITHPQDPVYDIVMRDGDRLFVPKMSQEVTVLGEVQYATSHIFEPGLSRNDYIARSGGLTQKADRRRIYVVRAGGSVLSGEGSRWFSKPDVVDIRPGDTIVVPLDADRMGTLAKWTNVSQIIYQLALAAASANAVGVF